MSQEEVPWSTGKNVNKKKTHWQKQIPSIDFLWLVELFKSNNDLASNSFLNTGSYESCQIDKVVVS